MPFDQIRVEMAKRRERERREIEIDFEIMALETPNGISIICEWIFSFAWFCVCVLSFLYCSVESSFPSSFVLVSPLVRVCISFYLGSFIGGCFSLDPNQTNFSCCFFSFSSPFHRSNGAASGKLRNSSTKIYSNEHPQSGWFHLYAVRKGAGHRI